MLVRKCSAGHDISIWVNGVPMNLLPKITSKLGSGKYYVVSNDEIILRTNDFKEATGIYKSECKKYHKKNEVQMGDFIVGKHKFENSVLKQQIKIKRKR